MKMIDTCVLPECTATEGLINLPRNADVLCAYYEDGQVWLDFLADTRRGAQDNTFEPRRFALLGAGYEMPPDMGMSDYVGSLVTEDERLHVFVSKVGPVMTEAYRGRS